MWRCHQLLSGVLGNGHLPRVQRQSRLSASDKGENDIIQRTLVQISWHLTYSRGTLRKTSARGPSMRAVRSVIASNGVPYLQLMSVGSSVCWEERRKGIRKGRDGFGWWVKVGREKQGKKDNTPNIRTRKAIHMFLFLCLWFGINHCHLSIYK